MFILFLLSVVLFFASIVWLFVSINEKLGKFHISMSIFFMCLFLITSIILFQTAQTRMYWIKFKVGAKKGTWIVVDNSGGKTLRHWILRNNYVKGADQTDGWEFFADSCSPCYVGGDAFVGKITEKQINGDYKKQFNIPTNQEPLH